MLSTPASVGGGRSPAPSVTDAASAPRRVGDAPGVSANGERGDERLLEEAEPVVDVVDVRPRVVVGQATQVSSSSSSTPSRVPSASRMSLKRLQPADGALGVELDVDRQAVLAELARQAGLLERLDHRDGARDLAVAQPALGEAPELAGAPPRRRGSRREQPGEHRVVGRAGRPGEVQQRARAGPSLWLGAADLVAQQLDELRGQRPQQVGLEAGEGGDDAAAAPALEASVTARRPRSVAHRRPSRAWPTGRTRASPARRAPSPRGTRSTTTALPSWCTSSISLLGLLLASSRSTSGTRSVT